MAAGSGGASDADFHVAVPPVHDPDANGEVQVLAPIPEALRAIVAPEALTFLAELARRFREERAAVLRARGDFRRRLRAGELAAPPPETRGIREGPWQVAPPPADLVDRRVEITGPVDRKTVVNALNSGAPVFMADFEDAHAPTWRGSLAGQSNLAAAVRHTLRFRSLDGRTYQLKDRTATLIVRPRGWHLVERHVVVDGEPMPASLFDVGLFLYHNAAELLGRGSGPYLYLPKLEDPREARLWDEVLHLAEVRLGLPEGSVRTAVLIETLPAALQMEEILYEIRGRSLGLNGGRWDYLFSLIKELRDDPSFRFPDRDRLRMTEPFLEEYSRRIVETCHRRRAQAIGGMAAEVPSRSDPAATSAAIAAVVADKERERRLGYDGTWVAHPGLVRPALEAFGPPVGPTGRATEPFGPTPDRPLDRLLAVPAGEVSPEGVRTNVRVALRYLEAWFRGVGCVAIDHRMEDAATVEIARALLWHWVRNDRHLRDGRSITPDLVRSVLAEEAAALLAEGGAVGPESVGVATRLVDELATGPDFPDFFTLLAYERLPDLPEPTGGP